MALEYCRLKKAKTETRTKSKSKQWKDDQSNVFSFCCLKYEKYCRKFWNPPCLTHWPTFVSRKFPQVQLLVGEFVDPIFRRVARAHRRANGAPRPRPSRPSMVSNFPKPPPDSSPRNAGQCGRSNSVLLLYFLRIQNIQGIFPNIANNSKYSLVPKFQSPTLQLPSIFSQFSPAMAEGKFSTLVHLLKFIETWIMIGLKHLWCVNEILYFCQDLYTFYKIVLTMAMPANDNLKAKPHQDEKTDQTKKFNG